MIILSSKDSFSLIVFMNLNSVIDISKINLWKNNRVTETVQQLTDKKKQISVFNDKSIEIVVIDTKTKLITLSENEENESISRTLRFMNSALCQHLIDIFIQSLEFSRRHIVDAHI